MKHTKTVTKKVKVTYTTCDLCGTRSHRPHQCHVCKRDLCVTCCVEWEMDPWTGEDTGDYPPIVCRECNRKVKSPSQQASNIMYEADAKIEILRTAWLKDCQGD